MLATQTDVEQVLQVDFSDDTDPTIAAYLAAADAWCKDWTGRNLEQAAYDVWPKPTRSLLPLPDWPIANLVVTENGTELTAGVDYVEAHDGILQRITGGDGSRTRGWSTRVRDIRVEADLGYPTVPAHLTRACALVAAAMFDEGRGGSGAAGPITSERIIDHAYTINLDKGDRWESAKAILRQYRRGDSRPVYRAWSVPSTP